MAKIILNSHDLLAQITILKSCLSLIENTSQNKNYLKTARQATEKLITLIKQTAHHGPTAYC